eukprot:15461174-Alexandrium_andersonii.AAC.1
MHRGRAQHFSAVPRERGPKVHVALLRIAAFRHVRHLQPELRHVFVGLRRAFSCGGRPGCVGKDLLQQYCSGEGQEQPRPRPTRKSHEGGPPGLSFKSLAEGRGQVSEDFDLHVPGGQVVQFLDTPAQQAKPWAIQRLVAA